MSGCVNVGAWKEKTTGKEKKERRIKGGRRRKKEREEKERNPEGVREILE